MHFFMQLAQQSLHIIQTPFAVVENDLVLARATNSIFRVALHQRADIAGFLGGLHGSHCSRWWFYPCSLQLVTCRCLYSSSSTSSPRAALAAVTIFSWIAEGTMS